MYERVVTHARAVATHARGGDSCTGSGDSCTGGGDSCTRASVHRAIELFSRLDLTPTSRRMVEERGANEQLQFNAHILHLGTPPADRERRAKRASRGPAEILADLEEDPAQIDVEDIPPPLPKLQFRNAKITRSVEESRGRWRCACSRYCTPALGVRCSRCRCVLLPPFNAPQQRLSQATGMDGVKAALLNPDGSEILWLGYGEGRCLSIWEQTEGFDPYADKGTLPLDENPCDLQVLNNDTSLVSTVNGTIQMIAIRNGQLRTVRTFSSVRNGGDARKIRQFDKNIVSGSSNGTIAIVKIETGKIQRINTGVAGIRAIIAIFGESILATGYSSGQLLLWDATDFSKRPSAIIPSKSNLDGVTALDTHPAQSNIIAFGTNNGAIGFSDIRGYSEQMQPVPYDIASSTITEIKFHPQNGDHLVCSSTDGAMLDLAAANSCEAKRSTRSIYMDQKRLHKQISLQAFQFSSHVNSVDFAGDDIVCCTKTAIDLLKTL